MDKLYLLAGPGRDSAMRGMKPTPGCVLAAVCTLAAAYVPTGSASPSTAPVQAPAPASAASSAKAKRETLVILLGSVRGGVSAWRSLEENLLVPNRADLALMIGDPQMIQILAEGRLRI